MIDFCLFTLILFWFHQSYTIWMARVRFYALIVTKTKSSAYALTWISLRVSLEISSLMYSLKRNEERTPPCGTHFLVWTCWISASDTVLLSITIIRFVMLSGSPKVFNFCTSLRRFTLTHALQRSRIQSDLIGPSRTGILASLSTCILFYMSLRMVMR